MAAVAAHYEFGASRRHFEFREVEGCGAMAGGLCENASRNSPDFGIEGCRYYS